MRHILRVAAFGLTIGAAHLAVAQGVSEGAPIGVHPDAPAVAAAPAGQPSAGNAQHGKLLFVSDGCYECHGYVGQGSTRTGPALAPNLIPMSAFEAQLRKPMDRMPPYTAVVLPEPDVADIYAYLQSLPKPPAAKDVALLQP